MKLLYKKERRCFNKQVRTRTRDYPTLPTGQASLCVDEHNLQKAIMTPQMSSKTPKACRSRETARRTDPGTRPGSSS